ncbi:STAS domain-containing protein [Streptomyces sp. SID13031]|uniref:STAS domain-containing protein n=1 Tax=Streptomyces sp. SID13031 TaxID=2706046 RepID=UPI0013C94469|nr:STAS domain-containing protein [Streptomyces sp. SID13031]NEA32382.1 STAS domain-containing protein [Streptomyces sp. SID13031]
MLVIKPSSPEAPRIGLAAATVLAGASGLPDPLNRVTVATSDGMITVAATGRIDQLTAVTFRAELLAVWPVRVGMLTVDLSACTYLSIGAVRALQYIWRHHPLGGGQLQITAEHPEVIAALDTANIPRVRVPNQVSSTS